MAQLETEDSVNGRAVRAICDIAQVHLPEYTDEYYPFQSTESVRFAAQHPVSRLGNQMSGGLSVFMWKSDFDT